MTVLLPDQNNEIAEPLVRPNATIFADTVTKIIFCKYQNAISEEDTRAVYQWIGHGLRTWFSTTDYRGMIVDFRDVEFFDFGNSFIVAHESRKVNREHDISIFPVSLLVSTIRQEVKVRTTMVNQVEPRKSIVKNQADALMFIDEWNLALERQFDLSATLRQTWPQVNHQ